MTKAPKKVCNQSKCEHKGKLQTITNFYKRTKSEDGRQKECKDCVKIRNMKHKDVTRKPTMTEAEQKEYANDFSYIKDRREEHRNEVYG